MTEEIKKDLNPEKGCCQSKEEKKRPQRKNTIEILAIILGIVVVLNIIVMGFFTFTVNNKLNQAIEITKPQEGELLLVLPESCPQCGDMAAEKKVLSSQNVELSDDKIYTFGTEKAKEVIERFELKKLPALIFVAEEEINSKLAQALEKGSRKVNNKVIVWESEIVPYFNLAQNQTMGLVNLIYITDKTCTDCYDVVAVQQPILQRFGLGFSNIESFDISENIGKELIEKYQIKGLPTIILSSETKNYPALTQLWNQVGTVEPDGMFVFREMTALGQPYKDLSTGKIVKPKAE